MVLSVQNPKHLMYQFLSLWPFISILKALFSNVPFSLLNEPQLFLAHMQNRTNFLELIKSSLSDLGQLGIKFKLDQILAEHSCSMYRSDLA